jgi:hypothetical protein
MCVVICLLVKGVYVEGRTCRVRLRVKSSKGGLAKYS